jgi:hypothetical protein
MGNDSLCFICHRKNQRSVNVDASGSAVQGDGGQAEELGGMLAAAVQAEIVNQQRPGGLLAGTR